MREKYLGDSYDIVKRFWCESLRAIAPLNAHPEFLPAEIRERYTAVTLIPVLDLESLPKKPFGILLDPDTGIPLPSASQKRMTPSHAPLPCIAQVMGALHPLYVICFDQSHYRQPGSSGDQQKQKKMDYLKARGLASFYYVSHASFLFITDAPKSLAAIHKRLVSLGIPESTLLKGPGQFNLDPPASDS
jgi:hypothetical protein